MMSLPAIVPQACIQHQHCLLHCQSAQRKTGESSKPKLYKNFINVTITKSKERRELETKYILADKTLLVKKM